MTATGTDIVVAELPVGKKRGFHDKEPLAPSPYGDGPAYPNPTDRVTVAVHCTKTGNIRQLVRCSLEDMHRQHAAFPDHHYVEVTDPAVHPERHIVDLATGMIKPRTEPTPGARARKEAELRIAARITEFQSAASGSLLSYSAGPDDLHALMAAVLIGGTISGIQHTPEQAKQALQAWAALRDQNAAKLDALLQKAATAATLPDLDTINW